jgi:hypothetical protein
MRSAFGRDARTFPCSFFDALEQRQYLSNPSVVDFSVDTPVAYPGKVITLTAHVAATAGVRAVVFWVENNDDALNQFIANSADQPLGDVFAPDAGTSDRYSIQVRVGASWQPPWKTSVKFGVDVVDSNGNYSQAPILFVSIDAKPKPFVQRMFAEPVPGGDIHLYAFTSVDGATASGTGIGGVTFFLDQNGNNQWDAGTDIDLGLGTRTSDGVYEKTITPQGGWNLTWFSASAFDMRASGDKFGPNHSTVLRGDNTPPVVALYSIQSRPGDTNSLNTSDESLLFQVGFNAAATMLGETAFLDRNQNGLWDVGIDVPLSQNFQVAGLINGTVDLWQDLSQLGHGWQSLGFAVHDASGRGNDSWSAVMTVWVNINNTPCNSSKKLCRTLPRR